MLWNGQMINVSSLNAKKKNMNPSALTQIYIFIWLAGCCKLSIFLKKRPKYKSYFKKINSKYKSESS